ncbi:MAG: hypothetical protein GY835_26205 [bacterium]|nr:hypothetical protein [bacterium]
MNKYRQALEYSLLDIINLFRRYVWFLGATLTAVVALGSFVVYFVLTPLYESTASLLPGHSDVVSSSIPLLDRGQLTGGFQIGNLTTRNSLNLELMASDTVRSSIVDSLSLVEFFDLSDLAQRHPEEARQLAMEELRQATHFELSMQIQILIVHVFTSDSDMSARIANMYLETLDKINRERYQAFAQHKVRYLDERLHVVKNLTVEAEQKVAQFKVEKRVFDNDGVDESVQSILADLQKMLLEKKIFMDAQSKDLSPTNPELIRLESEIDVYAGMVAAIQNFGNEDSKHESQVSQGIPRNLNPAEQIAYKKLKYDLSLLQNLQLFLLENRESAHLQTILDTETMTVLDHPFPASEPVWPNEKLLILQLSVCALFASAMGLLFFDACGRLGKGSFKQGLRIMLRLS